MGLSVPLQIVFKDFEPSAFVKQEIMHGVKKLEAHYPSIVSCRVAIAIPHRHHRRGNLFHVRIDIRLPGRELLVSRRSETNGAYKDLRVLLGESFGEAEEILKEYLVRKNRIIYKKSSLRLRKKVAQVAPERRRKMR